MSLHSAGSDQISILRDDQYGRQKAQGTRQRTIREYSIVSGSTLVHTETTAPVLLLFADTPTAQRIERFTQMRANQILIVREDRGIVNDQK